MTFKNVLCPVDFSENTENIARLAVKLSEDGAKIVLFNHSVLISPVLGPEAAISFEADRELRDLAKMQLDKLAAKLKLQYPDRQFTTYHSYFKNITDEINDVVTAEHIDLIVMGTQGKDSKSDLFLGSNAYRLVTKAPMPVMTIKNLVNKKGYQNILLPIDLSDHSRQKVNYALSMAKAFNAKITILGLYDENEKGDKFKLEIVVNQIAKLCEKQKITFEQYIDKTHHRVSKTNSFAKKHKNDLVITMTDQKIEGFRGILSSYDHELIHTSKIPVISIEPEINSDISTGGTPGLPF